MVYDMLALNMFAERGGKGITTRSVFFKQLSGSLEAKQHM
jgi:hypothetical protein